MFANPPGLQARAASLVQLVILLGMAVTLCSTTMYYIWRGNRGCLAFLETYNPNITPIVIPTYCRSFHFLFHYPNITPMYTTGTLNTTASHPEASKFGSAPKPRAQRLGGYALPTLDPHLTLGVRGPKYGSRAQIPLIVKYLGT